MVMDKRTALKPYPTIQLPSPDNAEGIHCRGVQGGGTEPAAGRQRGRARGQPGRPHAGHGVPPARRVETERPQDHPHGHR